MGRRILMLKDDKTESELVSAYLSQEFRINCVYKIDEEEVCNI